MQAEHAHEVVGLERHATGDELEQDAAHRVDVDAVIDVLAARLLRRHVLGRAEQHAGLRELAPPVLDLGQLRDAEVEQLHEVRLAEEVDEVHVLRLEIAVDDAVRMCGGERCADLQEDPLAPRPRQQLTGEARTRDLLVQVVALEQLHREEHEAFGRGAEVADVDHVLVTNARGALGLLHEPLDEVGLARELAVQDLERDLLLEQVVRGEIDGAHTALAELLGDVVAPRHRRSEERIGRVREIRGRHPGVRTVIREDRRRLR